MKKVLLHICCGICGLASIEKLKEEFYVEGFFFNPNIYPPDEYLRRKRVAQRVARIYQINMIEGKYDFELWEKVCGVYKDEEEGGKRCLLCYELRLQETKKELERKKFDYFTTTLTISPHKDSKAIIEIGKNIGKAKFLAIDFKKKEGFRRTMELAKKYKFYKQNYCGCIYSREPRAIG